MGIYPLVEYTAEEAIHALRITGLRHPDADPNKVNAVVNVIKNLQLENALLKSTLSEIKKHETGVNALKFALARVRELEDRECGIKKQAEGLCDFLEECFYEPPFLQENAPYTKDLILQKIKDWFITSDWAKKNQCDCKDKARELVEDSYGMCCSDYCTAPKEFRDAIKLKFNIGG